MSSRHQPRARRDEPHDDSSEVHEHDLGLAHDLPRLISRRSALGAIGGGLGLVLAGCGSDGGSTTGGGTTTSATSATTTQTNGTSGASAVPEETAGPYPGDGSNGPNVLTESGVVRRDITRSFGGASGTADGIPATVELKLIDVAAGGGPLAGAAVYLWHCDRNGAYSLYDQAIADQNFLRGIQESDDQGRLWFTTIFPAAYSGRWPHIHFEIRASRPPPPRAASCAPRSWRSPRTSARRRTRPAATSRARRT
jgi:hypothetical protein